MFKAQFGDSMLEYTYLQNVYKAYKFRDSLTTKYLLTRFTGKYVYDKFLKYLS